MARICITRAILKLLAVRESGVYLDVNEHFTNKADAKRALLDEFFNDLCTSPHSTFRTLPR